MTRRHLEPLLLTLESTPLLLARAVGRVSREQAAIRPRGGGFSLVEHVWHLADLEREGYAARIRRLLHEDEPMLSDFEGDRIARERCYVRRDIGQGLAAFAEARRANVESLRGLPRSAWRRSGVQQSVGRVTLSDIPQMMSEHDRSHTRAIQELLEQIAGGVASSVGRGESAVA